MNKLFFLFLLIPCLANAWEASVGAGYYGRKFNELDNLGAFQGYTYITPEHTSGGSLNITFLFDINENFRLGVDSMFNYGQQSVQETFLNFKSYQTWSYIAAPTIQYRKEDFIAAFKPGFIINGMTGDYKHRIDIDTGLSFALRISAEAFDSQRIFFEPQVILTPSTNGNYKLVVSPAIIVGIEQIFISKEKVFPAVIDPPKEITPVSIAAMPTATTVEPEKPKNLVLKFDGNNLDPESMWFLKKVLEVYKTAPSVISIYHKNTKDAEAKSQALSKWLLEHGVPQEDLIIKGDLKNREIKIEVNKK